MEPTEGFVRRNVGCSGMWWGYKWAHTLTRKRVCVCILDLLVRLVEGGSPDGGELRMRQGGRLTALACARRARARSTRTQRHAARGAVEHQRGLAAETFD